MYIIFVCGCILYFWAKLNEIVCGGKYVIRQKPKLTICVLTKTFDGNITLSLFLSLNLALYSEMIDVLSYFEINWPVMHDMHMFCNFHFL